MCMCVLLCGLQTQVDSLFYSTNFVHAPSKIFQRANARINESLKLLLYNEFFTQGK